MKLFLLPAFLFFCVGIQVNLVHADSDIYSCVSEKGLKTYSNVGNKKGCKKVDLPGLTTIPAPNSAKATKRTTKVSTSPSAFPQVDDATQKNRDTERKQILETELKAEQKKLTDLNTEYKNGEPDRLGNERNYAKYQERTENLKQDINRSQQNIDALQREIGGLQ